jgi:hypothetical protein
MSPPKWLCPRVLGSTARSQDRYLPVAKSGAPAPQQPMKFCEAEALRRPDSSLRDPPDTVTQQLETLAADGTCHQALCSARPQPAHGCFWAIRHEDECAGQPTFQCYLRCNEIILKPLYPLHRSLPQLGSSRQPEAISRFLYNQITANYHSDLSLAGGRVSFPSLGVPAVAAVQMGR